MIYQGFPKLAGNLLLFLLSSMFVIALLGIFFMTIYSQEMFPRALVAHSGRLQSTFYPNTFDRSNPQPYTAILGDSYGQGMGDAYLSNQPKYSVAHFLNADDHKNYLTFARSGFGSVNAVAELPRTIKWADQSPFVPALGKPERILFFFYEGNDLINNLDHLEELGLMGSSPAKLIPAISNKIMDRAAPSKKNALEAWIPFYTLFENIGQIADGLVYDPYIRREKAIAEPFPVTADFQEQMRFIAQHRALQSAAAELDEEKLQKGIDVLLISLEALRTLVKNIPITVVYIPSPISTYDWGENVMIQSHYSGEASLLIATQKNMKNSAYIQTKISKGVEDMGINFVDATPALRLEGRTHLLHGLRDIKHFNADGYRILAKVIQGAQILNE